MVKRCVDFFGAVCCLVLLAPVLLTVGIAVRIVNGKPVIFSQQRPGLRGQPFIMYKFRTMRDVRDEQGELLPDSQRLTALGRFLRASSLDELPELVNVLKGEMSFVGPRPLLMEYLPHYNSFQARRHDVKPGITGWAQVNGRNSLSWEEKFALDVWYVDNQSFWLDCRIILMTAVKVFQREGISQEGQATMSKFNGSDNDHC